ncbi:MAG: hypothetical protein DMF75_09130 [Acidobacteria bacterium]|nr:MAG: hypothetical protein DMF75_09130 [Acidobacteriota bacterium]
MIYSATRSAVISYGRLGKSLRPVSPPLNFQLMIKSAQGTCSILVVENSDDFRAGLADELRQLGHTVTAASERSEGLVLEDRAQFDLLVSDLVNQGSATEPEIVRSFKMAVTSSEARRAIADLHDIIEKTFSFKLRRIDAAQPTDQIREKIELELPSNLTLMNGVLEYLVDRVARLGLIKVEQSNLFVALDEAFVNAVKHGNRNDTTKLLRITAELSAREAIFTVEDEGEGFDVCEIPDPRDSANLFKSSGRGVLLIYNIMDEVEYSERGTRLRMVKRPEGLRP